MTNPDYPNIAKLGRLVDRGLGLVFALVKIGVFLLAALILVALIAL